MFFGNKTERLYDVGVAGVHRVFRVLRDMIKQEMDVYIVAAGREGALPTLIAGMVSAPVIGVPISTGYGIAPPRIAARPKPRGLRR